MYCTVQHYTLLSPPNSLTKEISKKLKVKQKNFWSSQKESVKDRIWKGGQNCNFVKNTINQSVTPIEMVLWFGFTIQKKTQYKNLVPIKFTLVCELKFDWAELRHSKHQLTFYGVDCFKIYFSNDD
jgi:hypothetical protein